jgi:hypothetical protein
MMSSTCSETKNSFSGRWLDVQVWCTVFFVHQYKQYCSYKTALTNAYLLFTLSANEIEYNAFRISSAKHKFLCFSPFQIKLSELHNTAKKAHEICLPHWKQLLHFCVNGFN